jgi:hypothetical protein
MESYEDAWSWFTAENLAEEWTDEMKTSCPTAIPDAGR